MSAIPTKLRARAGGTAIVEAAVVLPLLLLLVFGALEYGWMFVVDGDIVNAARQGARAAITPSATLNTVTTQINTALQNAGLKPSDFNTPTITPSNWSTAASGTVVNVTVGIPYSKVSLTHFPLPVPTILQVTVAMAKEGPSS
jgi:Flp pilus assembly protein TadG